MSNPPKPIEIRQLEGNKGKRPMPKAISFKDASSRIPDELTGYARDWFKLTSTELRNARLLKVADVPKLAVIAQVYATMREAQEGLKQGLIIVNDKGEVITNPCESIFRLNAKLYHDMAASFGLSPVDRTRLATAIGGNSEIDPEEEKLKRAMGLKS